MKNYIFILATLFLISCNGLFDKTNLESISSDVVWEDAALIEAYVNNLYATYPTWSRTENDISDESRNGYKTFDAWRFIRGEWGLEYNPMNYWAYKYVRKCNEILFNIESSPIEVSLKNRISGEVKFLRAITYFEMLKRYGGVPLVTVPQSMDSEDLYPKRATIDELFDFITKEFAEAATLLEDYKVHDKNNFGRVTWGACKTLEARAYMFWASPLYNTSNDLTKWEKAVAANKEIIESGLYSLQTNVRNIFLDRNSPENIFAIYFQMPERYHGVDAMCKPRSIANGDAAHWGPIQELVDAFPTINGLAIDKDPSFDPLHPYDNRDPRLQAFIVVNESQYCGRTQYNYWGLGDVDPSFPKEEADRFISIDLGGEHEDASSAAHNSITGYLCRKMIEEDLPKDAYSYGWGSTTPFIEIRLGEVFLNYAEALNEIGDTEIACEYLEKIRNRAGILNPEVPDYAKSSKESLRKFIHNERYIELCFEQKRYWDLKRWKEAKETLNGRKFHGMKIYLNILNNSDVINTDEYKNAPFVKKLDMLKKTWTYEPYEVDDEPYLFDEKMYFMPIPRSDMETNPNLVQNEGW